MFAYLDYIPGYLRELRELRAIGGAVDAPAAELQDRMELLTENQCVSSADLETLRRWENILGLPFNPVFSLEERRQQILSRMRMQSVITLEKLADLLSQLTNGGSTVALDADLYRLTIRIALTSKYSFNNVAALLHDVVPANIVIDLSLLYNQHSTLARHTHAQLAAFTHQQLREDVLIDSSYKVFQV